MMNEIELNRLDLNLLVVFEVLMDTRSVTLAARRLGRTPSAVSHALQRLREQVGDPLMVKVAGKMQPSPFAEQLIEEVRPILRAIQRVVQPPKPFDPATSDRVFRLAIPAVTSVVSQVSARVNAEAPGASLEWIAPSPKHYTAIADEQIDLALTASDPTLPEGIASQTVAPAKRFTFLRDRHPAVENWGLEAWMKWPHVIYAMSGSARQTVAASLQADNIERHVGVRIPEISGVAPLLSRSDMLFTTAATFLIQDVGTYGLRVAEPPLDLPDITFRFIWSSRLSNDPGNIWLRSLVLDVYDGLLEQSDAFLESTEILGRS